MNGKLDRHKQQLVGEDIPVAQRDRTGGSSAARPRQSLPPLPWKPAILSGLALGVIVAGGFAARALPWERILAAVTTIPTDPRSAPEPPPTIEAETPPSEPDTPEVTSEDLLGHRPYPIAPVDGLKAVTADSRVRLRQPAAEQFLAMQSAARAQGISLAALSGYRTFEEQKYLFFQIKANRGQDARDRARVSAPPGYSEHHTGYAIDIGDGSAPSTHIEESFATTPAFRWLERNAARYGFELSFPPDNPQGISYEPWHWRYVGDLESLETFYKGNGSKP